MSAQRQGRAVAQCRAFVREHDLDAYLATLLAPQDDQPRLFAIWTIAADALRLPWSVSEPAMAAIRLQWWREALKAGQGHPALQLLAGEDMDGLDAFLDACERLHGAPLATVEACLEWGRGCFSPLMEALAGEADARLAGGHGLVFVLRRAPFRRANGLFLMAKTLERRDVLEGAEAELAGSVAFRRALLPFLLSRPWLKRLRKGPNAGFPQWRRQLHLAGQLAKGMLTNPARR